MQGGGVETTMVYTCKIKHQNGDATTRHQKLQRRDKELSNK